MKYRLTNKWVLVALLTLVFWIAPASARGEGVVELKTRTATYTNVTVARKDGTNIYIKHAGGMSNIKLHELDPDAQQSLGYAVATSSTNGPAGAGPKASSIRRHEGRRQEGESEQYVEVQFVNGVILQVGGWEIQLSRAALAGLAVGYLLFCCCACLLCQKTGTKPGLLIWLPILQMFPLLRAAGMSGWWFLALFVPILNVVAWLGWCVNIVISRRKSLWWALLLILPVTNVTAFVYLSLAKKD